MGHTRWLSAAAVIVVSLLFAVPVVKGDDGVDHAGEICLELDETGSTKTQTMQLGVLSYGSGLFPVHGRIRYGERLSPVHGSAVFADGKATLSLTSSDAFVLSALYTVFLDFSRGRGSYQVLATDQISGGVATLFVVQPSNAKVKTGSVLIAPCP